MHCAPGSVMTLELGNVRQFGSRCPEQYNAIIECAAFVNWRRIEVGESAVLALSFRMADEQAEHTPRSGRLTRRRRCA